MVRRTQSRVAALITSGPKALTAWTAVRPVDLEAIQLHHVAFTFANALSFSHTLKSPSPESDYTTNLQWCNETNLFATEAIAEYLDVDLPAVEPTSHGPPGSDQLMLIWFRH